MKLCVVLMAAALLPALPATPVLAQDAAPDEAQQNVPPKRNPAEDAEYANARKVADPARRAEALENFVKRYPNSEMKVEAWEWAMAAYQQTGNAAKAGDLAKRILEIQPQSVRALYVYVAQARALGDQAPDDAREAAMQGMLSLNAWQSPEGMPDAEYTRLRGEMTATFASASAYYAMVGRDLGTARMYYQQALQVNPMSVEDTYSLGLVEMEMQPLDPAGFWYIARAVHLAKSARNGSESFIANYGRVKYAQFHGSLEGWAEIVTRAANETTIPDDFTVGQSSPPDN